MSHFSMKIGVSIGISSLDHGGHHRRSELTSSETALVDSLYSLLPSESLGWHALIRFEWLAPSIFRLRGKRPDGSACG